MRFSLWRAASLLFVALPCVLLPYASVADTAVYQNKAGSTGVVDESDRREVEFASGRVRIKSNKERARATLRYDLDFSDLLGGDVGHVSVSLRYRDDGSDARVIVKFKRYHILSGGTETLLVFDSDEKPQADGYRYDFAQDTSPGITHGSQYAYWIEVTLIKNDRDARPELAGFSAGMSLQ